MSMLKNDKLVVGVLYVLAMFIAAMDTTIINVALPVIGKEFQVPPSSTGSVNIGYLVSLAMSLPVAGWLGDRWGTKRIFMIALAIFTVASALCGLAQSLTSLNIFRIMQGAGAGLIAPVGMAMLFRTFTNEERPKVSRMLVVPIALAPAIGPVLGGFFTDQLSWRWIFYINLPFGIIALLIAKRYLKEHIVPTVGRFDIKGFLLSLPGFAMLIYALTEGPGKGWMTPTILFIGLTGLSFIIVLVIVELRTSKPMLDFKLFEEPVFRTMSIIGLCSAAGLLGMLFAFPLMYQNALNVSPLHTGLTTFPEALGLMLASQLMPWSMKKLGVYRLIRWALAFSVLIFVLIALAVESNPWIIRFLMFNVGLFLGHAVGAAQITAFKNITSASMSKATTLYNVQNRLGSVLGVAILASLLGTPGSEQMNLVIYQIALAVAAAFLFISFLVILKFKESPDANYTSNMQKAEVKVSSNNGGL